MTRFRNAVVLSAGVIPSDCHPEQASFAQRGIWASRATGVPDTPGFGVAGWANRCEFTNDEKTARLARFPIGVRLPARRSPTPHPSPHRGLKMTALFMPNPPKAHGSFHQGHCGRRPNLGLGPQLWNFATSCRSMELIVQQWFTGKTTNVAFFSTRPCSCT